MNEGGQTPVGEGAGGGGPRPPFDRGPFDRRTWRSPLRGPWLASVLSLWLLVLFGIDAVTGYLSYVAYQPTLGPNSVTGDPPDLWLYGWRWPTEPAWLYALNQGLHIAAGVAAVPVLAAKLWAVMPQLYKWPPAASPAQALERMSLGLLVASSIFLLFSGLYNIAYWIPWEFSFITAHLYAAYVFVAALVAHVVIKAPTVRRAFRDRGVLRPLRDDLAHTEPEPFDGETTAPAAPDRPTVSRRGLLGLVAAASTTLVALLAGQSLGGWARVTALLAPRGREQPPRLQGFPVNKTAEAAGIRPEQVGDGWRLELVGRRTVTLSRDELLAMTLHTEDLPLACVEGWTTWQRWTGVRLRDLAALVGATDAEAVLVESLQSGGSFRSASLHGGQLRDAQSLLALRVGGEELDLDHGYPARVIVPALPGVHNTKWVARMTFDTA